MLLHAFTALMAAIAVIPIAWAMVVAYMQLRVFLERRWGRGPDPKWYSYGLKSRPGYYIHGPKWFWSAEWSWRIPDYNFGYGFRFGRNGSDSDIGLDIYLGRLFCCFLRFKAPWTKVFRVRRNHGRYWYEPRHYGIVLRPHKHCRLDVQFGYYEQLGMRTWRKKRWLHYE